ncbi:metal ABC transporter substrate-binding protein [Schaalia sp. ZJ405]|uniref:metal ABC transporter substrate-binding protein n=1 Tax=Schaalia sp. ZJ405 TaxID=2709403 RepID=UPI003FA76723
MILMKRHSFLTYAAPATVAAVSFILAGCSGASSTQSAGQSDGASDKPLSVMTSFYPLKYLTERIGGDLVSVTSLTPDGAEPHDLELSPATVDQLGRADAVVYLSGFQAAVDDAVKQNAPKTVIDVAEAVSLVDTSDDPRNNHPEHSHDHGDAHDDHDHEGHDHEGHDHDHEAHDHEGLDHDHEAHDHEGHDHEAHGDHDSHEDGDHEGHDHEAHDHDDHDHGTTDPHFWLDPDRMGQAATAIGQALAKADPKNAQHYTQNAAAVTKSMTKLSTELVEGTATCRSRTFVTAHTAFGYLADRTQLTQMGISGLSPDSTPSPARLKEIADFVKAENVSTIFTESLIDPKVAETLASDLGIKTDVLDPIESQVDSSKDYEAVMHDNLVALRKALDCE